MKRIFGLILSISIALTGLSIVLFGLPSSIVMAQQPATPEDIIVVNTLDDDGEITEHRKINSPTDADLERKAKISIGPYRYLPDNIKTMTIINRADPDPSPAGEPINVYVTVLGFPPTGGWVHPSGLVSVTANPGNYSCSLWVPERVHCSLTILLPGNYVITAAYQGYDGALPSSSQVNHPIRARTTTTLISDIPAPSLPWQPFTVTFSVTSTTRIPAGGVGVTVEGSESICLGALNGGLGSCTMSLAWPGEYTLTATYDGEWFSMPSSASAIHVVDRPITDPWLYLPLIVFNPE